MLGESETEWYSIFVLVSFYAISLVVCVKAYDAGRLQVEVSHKQLMQRDGIQSDFDSTIT